MAEIPKRSKGRQRIEMEKIKNEANLLVTFSKRHRSIYRKAHELNSLTGAKVAIIGFSPKNKPFSFGCPNVPSILEYQSLGPLRYTNAPADSLVELGAIATLKQWNDEIMFLEEKLRREMKQGEAIDAKIQGSEKHWWEVPTVGLDLEQAEKLQMDLMSVQTHMLNAPPNPQVPDRLLDCYVPNIDFITPQYAAALPSSINDGIYAGGAPAATIEGCSSNQTAHLNPLPKESATAGILQYAGSSLINPNVQPVPGESGSIGFHYDPMASGSSSTDTLLHYWYDHGFDLEDYEFFKLFLG